ncbi:MAG: NUDIX domain-containing protein, partial [Actinomycetales bacterium]|nr:NUDIX domain-containing protein [Actinomycetales bacterium]
ALRREVLEEVSLPVTQIEYRGSQTWPFPASLMLAYTARATSTQIEVDGIEVADARWFDRPGLREASSSGEVLLPGRASIARALIEDWYGGTLP